MGDLPRSITGHRLAFEQELQNDGMRKGAVSVQESYVTTNFHFYEDKEALISIYIPEWDAKAGENAIKGSVTVNFGYIIHEFDAPRETIEEILKEWDAVENGAAYVFPKDENYLTINYKIPASALSAPSKWKSMTPEVFADIFYRELEAVVYGLMKELDKFVTDELENA